MLCYLDYISAVRRLHEAEKTVTMLKGDKYSERDVPMQVLAQRDFIKKEKEYYGDDIYEMVLFLNSSEERGINSIRDKVHNFSKTNPNEKASSG